MNKLLLILLSLLLISCGKTVEKKNSGITYVVASKPIHQTLHFTGTVQPLGESTLTSPMGAVVERMNFYYGEQVKKNDVVLTLNSSELQKQYNELLTEYLK